MGGRTTQFARTIATLQGVLTGLWPDASVPASITTASDQGELLYGEFAPCSYGILLLCCPGLWRYDMLLGTLWLKGMHVAFRTVLPGHICPLHCLQRHCLQET